MKRLAAALLAAALWSATAGAADALSGARAAAERRDYGQAERELRQRLAAHPADEEARFLLARVLAWSGQHAAALREYDRLLKSRPRSSDYLLGAAHAHLWSGNPAAALPLLREARRLAPGYEDVWRAQVEALLALGDEDRLRQARIIRAEARRRFPASKWEFAKLDAPAPVAVPGAVAAAPAKEPAGGAGVAVPPPAAQAAPPPAIAAPVAAAARATEIELGYSYERLTNGQPDWSSFYLEASHRYAPRHSIYGVLRHARRFDLEDTEGLVGLYYPLTPEWTINVEGGGSASHNVLPTYTVYGQAHRALGEGWGIALGWRHNEFTGTGVGITTALLERYWSNYRAAYTLYLGRPDGGPTSSSHQFQADYFYGDRDRVGLSYTTGKETENVGPPRGLITSEVRDITLLGRHWLSRDWAVSYEVVAHEQGTLYRRRGARLGLRYAF